MAALQTFGPGTLGGLGTFGPGTFRGGTPLPRWMVPGPCGCCTCTYFLDRFTRADSGDLGDNWDEQLGAWAIENYRAKTSSSNARLICNAVDTPNNDEHVVSAALRGMGVGDQPRLISSKLTGADTYWFFQMTYGATTVDLDLYHRTDGSDIQRGSTTTLFNMAPGIPLALRICFDGSTISAQYRRITDTIWTTATSYATTGITDPICGVGTGTVNNEVRVDDFRLEKHGTLYPGCPLCAQGPRCPVCDGPMPDEFLIVPTGNLDTLPPLIRPLLPSGGYVLRRGNPMVSNQADAVCWYSYHPDLPAFHEFNLRQVDLLFQVSRPSNASISSPWHTARIGLNIFDPASGGTGYLRTANWGKYRLLGESWQCNAFNEEQGWTLLTYYPYYLHLITELSGFGWKVTAL